LSLPLGTVQTIHQAACAKARAHAAQCSYYGAERLYADISRVQPLLEPAPLG
jgi:hypothetical protein